MTVALGSTLATVLLDRSISLAEGVLALALLVFLQFVIAWLSVRSERIRDLVKSEPTLLLHQGRFLDAALRDQRVTRDEVLAAMRASGIASHDEAAAVVLETDGTISVVKNQPDRGAAHRPDTLKDVPGNASRPAE